MTADAQFPNFLDQYRLVALSAAVGRALTTHGTLIEMLHGCAAALVDHLDAAFARIWTLNEAEGMLELQASAGLYTHTDGPHGRVPVGKFKIGLIAQERQPHLTNEVVTDPRVSDQEWAKREGMVAFAGYPLIVEDRLVGVAAMFACQPLPEMTLLALGSVADQIAVGIDRRRTEEALRVSAERLSLAARSAGIGAWDFDPVSGGLVWDERCRAAFGLAPDAPVDYGVFLTGVHPEDRERMEQAIRSVLAPDSDGAFRQEFRAPGRDGVERWILSAGQAYFDAGRTRAERFTGIVIDITERKNAEAELADALRREALLNRIGQAVRQTASPEEVERTALAGLAQALGADRCLSIVIDRPNDLVRFVGEWRRPDLPPLVGDYRLSDFVVELAEVFPFGKTLVVPDTQTEPWSAQTAAVMAQMQIRALMDVPLSHAGEVVGVLGVYMADAPRAWTSEEVALVEAVASQLRAATEAMRLRQREHNIATQLQAALLPAIPPRVPGLRLGHHYRAALQEAGIGGDFASVFSSDKGVSYLVVGDLAGKGLAAASQIAIVSNMLRFAVLNGQTLAEALTSLNATLADNDLLTGFATLFIGRFEAPARTLTYVNCGQDAGLVRRAATGAIETLPPTGPVLGAIGGAVYAEQTVTLKPGDALALYTDGLSEAGPTRTALLTADGVAGLLQRQTGDGSAPEIVSRLIADVDSFAQGIVRDDQCVLVGIVE